MIALTKTSIDSMPLFMQQHGPFILLVICPCLILLLKAVLKRPKVKGALGEWAVNRALIHQLNSERYRVLHNLLLPDGKGGQTQIDHVVVSAYGLFVIETKNWACWIFGDEKARQWTLCYRGGRKERVMNPLRQNEGHARAVCALLGTPRAHCHNLVFINPVSRLKTGPIPGVFQRGLVGHIQSCQEVVFDAGWVESSVNQLLAASKSSDKASVAAHLAQVKGRQRYA